MKNPIIDGLLEGYLRPRASARRMLDAGHGTGVAMQLILLATVVQLIVFYPSARDFAAQGEEPVQISLLSFGVMWLIGVTMAVFLTAALVLWIGRVFDGTGTFGDALLLSAWNCVLASLLMTALVAIGILLPVLGLLAILNIAAGVLALRVFACFIAELHGFSSFWHVVGVLVAATVGLNLMLAYLLS